MVLDLTEFMHDYWDGNKASYAKACDKYNQLVSDCQTIFGYIAGYGMSLRQCEKETGISKSRVHRYAHKYLTEEYCDEWDLVTSQLNYNLEHKFKGKAKRYR